MTTLRAALVLVVVCAVGCGKGDGATKSKPAPAPEAKPPEKKEVEPAPPPAPIRVEGFKTPESVLYDSDKDVYYVSNINGSPFDKDGNGFISKVKPDGTVEQLEWVTGLNAPKGMTLLTNTLYVADIDVVRTIDIDAGKLTGEIAIKGATFLNDVTQDAGIVYVSDSGLKPGEGGFAPSGTDAIWQIDKDGKVTAVVKDPSLPRPNGLLKADALYMVTFGANELRKVYDGKTEVSATLPKGGLDGIVMYLDDLYISSWECQCVYKGKAQGPFEPVIEGVKSPADIGWDSRRKRILIPQFEDNVVLISPI